MSEWKDLDQESIPVWVTCFTNSSFMTLTAERLSHHVYINKEIIIIIAYLFNLIYGLDIYTDKFLYIKDNLKNLDICIWN